MTQRLLTIAVALAALWFGSEWLFPGDERQIRAVLDRVREGIEDSDGVTGVEALARIAALQNEFSTDATVDAGPPFERLAGRQSIVAAAARVRALAHNLELHFPDVAIEVADDGQSATATVTAEARFDEPGAGRALDTRELEVGFARFEGRWVIGAVSLIQPLERLDRR